MSLLLIRGGLLARRYFLIRCTVVVMCGVLVALASARSAQAVLVYERQRPSVSQIPRQGMIVVANDDGSNPRVIAKGTFPVVAPDGRHVAFFAGHSGGRGLWVVRVDGSHRRRLVRHTAPRTNFEIYNPLAWSPDSRYIVGNIATPCLASGHCGTNVPVTLVNIGRGVLARYPDIDPLDGAAFSPDSRRFVLGQAPPNSPNPNLVGTLKLAKTPRPKHLRSLGPGEVPAWGQPGLAYMRPNTDGLDPSFNEIDLVAAPGGVPRPLFRGKAPNGDRLAVIVGWANGPGDLLAGVDDGSTKRDIQPVLIDPRTRTMKYFPPKLTRISAISRDGSTVLGESLQREVVAVRADGTVKVLASHADSVTWTS